ncbi:MAG TPA: transcriptional repressor [Pirellulales bacterium]|jgi:Fur family ferric uptake transcriptional regulator|nr:transcriptional repressor [Pirellulales bacterium]
MKVTKRAKQPDFAAYRDRIRQAGLRSTQARVAILERLHQASGPMTHAQVAEELENRGFDKTTIYRSLVELAEARILSRMELGDHVWRYELRDSGDKRQDDHLHFVCVDCGRIECLEGTSAQAALAPSIKRAATGTISDVLLKGHCRQCE